MKKILKRYAAFIAAVLAIGLLTLFFRDTGLKAIGISVSQFRQMLLVIPPIFILLGLLDVWIPRETMVKYMGEGSGLKGVILSFILGSAAAGPLYGAFPIAAVFMRKGVKFSNLLIFIGAWSTTKVPMFLFEMSSLGTKFAVTRLLIDIPGILIIAFVLAKLIPKNEVEKLYKNAENLE
jgi:uncharacterized membrane protein YraQ (UPF0718 family)